MTGFSGVKLVIWDLDGTLLDSYGVYVTIMTEAVELSGMTMPDEQTLRHNFHGSMDEIIKAALGIVDDDHVAKILNDFLRIQEDYYKTPEDHLFADSLDLMKLFGATGAVQVVVTNREHEGRGNASPRYLVENTSLNEHISFVVAGDEGVRKPDAEVVAHVPGITSLSADEILVIGDQFVDAKLAQNLGARAVIVNRGDDQVPHLAEIGSDTSFLTIVASLNEVEVS